MAIPSNQTPDIMKKAASEQSNLSATAQFVKSVLDPFYIRLADADIIRIANEMVKKGNKVNEKDVIDYSLKCRELAAAEIERIQKDNIADTAQTDKITNVLNNFVERMIASVAPENMGTPEVASTDKAA